MKIYIDNFQRKKGNFEPIPRGAYDAEPDKDQTFLIKGPDGIDHAVKIGEVDNDYFSCSVSRITSEEDIRQIVKAQTEKVIQDMNNKLDRCMDLAGEIICHDSTLLDPLHDLFSHIQSTQKDKYESDSFNLLDIYGLKYSGTKYSSGFNIGNASSYLKRYMTEGFSKSYQTNDLLKAIHFILFELESRKNGN